MGNTIQQDRALFALEHVQRVISKPLEEQKEFKNVAAELPAMIHMNGLGQAVAFYCSKRESDKGRRWLYECLDEWLRRDGQIYSGGSELLSSITTGNQRSYRLAQVEALSVALWVKKFATAFLDSD
jgi:CRISPR-associated protein Cmr5